MSVLAGFEDSDTIHTVTSSCTDTLVCQGVSTGVAVQPEIVVPSFESPKQVKIPVSVEVGDTPGRKKAAVVLQGLVSCFEIPRELAPSRCANDDTADVNRGHTAGLRSVFLRVTPKINRSLGRTQSRTMTVRLPLTKMGQKLFAKLGITPEGFPLQIQSTIGDRQGRRIRTNFPTVLRREP